MSNVLKSLKHILEIIWLFAGIACLGIAIYENTKGSFKTAIPFYLFCAFSLFFIFHDEKKGLLKRTNGLSFEQLYCYWGSIKIIIFEKK